MATVVGSLQRVPRRFVCLDTGPQLVMLFKEVVKPLGDRI